MTRTSWPTGAFSAAPWDECATTPTSDGLPKHGYFAANPLVEEAERAIELLRHNPDFRRAIPWSAGPPA